jgi:hypothetical protein
MPPLAGQTLGECRHQPAKDYVARRLAEGKTKREALRCLKRHLVRTVFNTMMSPTATALDLT